MHNESNSRKLRPATWPYRADPPQRYWGQYQRYQERGGLIDLEEDIRGFVAGGAVGDISRFYFFCMAFDQIHKEGLPGDLAELGVYRGHTATMLARSARRLGRVAYLLDTFEGFSSSDIKGVDANQPVQFTDTSLEAVRNLVGDDSVEFIKGHFPDSVTSLPETSYCLVHIDCDLYAPIKSALQYFYPRIVSGGFLIIHDYSSLAWDGAERAVDEFFADKPEAIVPLTDGAGSVVIRKIREPRAALGSLTLTHDRSTQLSENWASVAAIAELLVAGWSACEHWGIWAVGSSHAMIIVLPSQWTGDLVVEADVHAPLMGEIQDQQISVLLDGKVLSRWCFKAGANRGIRSVRVPAAFISLSNDPTLRLEFRPERIVCPAELGAPHGDTRPLSFALHRLRRAAAD
jgi:hypothetical protein